MGFTVIYSEPDIPSDVGRASGNSLFHDIKRCCGYLEEAPAKPDAWARALARTTCYCSMCGHRAYWEPTLDPHSLYRSCPVCGWFDTVDAPGRP